MSNNDNAVQKAIDYFFEQICYDPDGRYLYNGEGSAGSWHLAVLMAKHCPEKDFEGWLRHIRITKLPKHRRGQGQIDHYHKLLAASGKCSCGALGGGDE